MSITPITSTTTLSYGFPYYFIDATGGNITLTVPLMANDFQFYNIVRIDNSVNTVNIVLDSTTLMSGESNFNIYGFSNVAIMSNGGLWYPVNGYSKDR